MRPLNDGRELNVAKYLLVFYGGGMPETPAAQARVLKQWGTWYGKLGPSVVDMGNPFSGAVNKIKADGTVAKGPIVQRATGYTIRDAGTLDTATKMAKGCPILKSGGQDAGSATCLLNEAGLSAAFAPRHEGR